MNGQDPVQDTLQTVPGRINYYVETGSEQATAIDSVFTHQVLCKSIAKTFVHRIPKENNFKEKGYRSQDAKATFFPLF